MQHKHATLAGASVLALLTVADVASAQTAPPQNTSAMVQEVIVTATRREATDTMKVPLAVSAFSGQKIQNFGIDSAKDLAKLDPSLNIQSYGPAEERIIIRGVSSDVGATTGVYLDETPLQGGFNDDIPGDNTPTLGLYDLDHVEVLKGPQGTLFGAGSMDGTLRIVTKQPSLESYSGWVVADAGGVQGGDGLFDGNGGVNIPVVKDTLGLRINVWGQDGGGFINQIIDGHTLDHVNDAQLYGFRVEALWKPTDRLSILGTASYQSTHVDGAQYWTQYTGGVQYPYAPYTGPYSPYTNATLVQQPYWQQFQLYSITGRYDLGFGNIIANTSYGYKNELSTSDTSPQDCIYDLCPGFGFDPAMYSAHQDFWYTTDDVRFASDFKGPLQLVAGVYYEHDHQLYNGSVMNASPTTGLVPCYNWNQCGLDGLIKPGANFGPGFAPLLNPANEVQFANESRQTTDQVAFYGQVDYKILPNLTATVGIRYFRANIEYELITQQNISPTETPYGFDGGFVLGQVTRPYLSAALHGTEGQPTYNFALLWEATPDISFYGRAASGFRIGGLNEAATIAAEANLTIPSTFGPDSLWDYEAGVKAYFLEHKLFVDLTGFHIDWSNEQETGLAYGIYGYTLNVGKTSINGVELNTTFRPISQLTLSGGFTYVDATLASDLPASVALAGTPGVKGDQMPFVPNWTATAQAEYDYPLNAKFTGYLQGNFTYHGSSFSTFEASPPADPADYYTMLPAYFLLDLKLGLRWDRYDVSVFAQNVTNTVAWIGANPNAGGLFVYSARPRTVGVRLTANF